MTQNPLYDALFAPLAAREDPLLILADGQTISGRAFHALIAGYAARLRALGVTPGDRVAAVSSCFCPSTAPLRSRRTNSDPR